MLDLLLLTGCAGGLLLIISDLLPKPMAPTSLQTKSLELLADGFARDFVDLVLTDDSFIELLHQLAYDFISENIPLTDDDMKFELGLMLLERTRFTTNRGL